MAKDRLTKQVELITSLKYREKAWFGHFFYFCDSYRTWLRHRHQIRMDDLY